MISALLALIIFSPFARADGGTEAIILSGGSDKMSNHVRYYRIGVRVERKVGDEGGVVRLVDIKGMELPSENALPILSRKPGACR